jgi:hypothetical protein
MVHLPYTLNARERVTAQNETCNERHTNIGFASGPILSGRDPETGYELIHGPAGIAINNAERLIQKEKSTIGR